MTAKKKTTRTSLMAATDMELRQRLVIAAETTADAVEQIVELLEQRNAQNGPEFVLVKGGPLTAQVRKMASERAHETVARAQLARFVKAIRGVMNGHDNCEHTDDTVMWLEIQAAGEEVIGVGWVDSD